MLGKLLKYEIKSTARIFLPLYVSLVLLAVISNIFFKINNNELFMNIISVISTSAYVFIIIAIFVLTLLVMIQRFYKNLLGDEGYLMFTLPVKTGEHIVSKLLTSMMWVITSTIVTIVSVLIISYNENTFASLQNAISQVFSEISRVFGINGYAYLIEFFIFLLMVLATNILMIYASIAVGQLVSKHKVLGAFGAYLGFYILSQIIISRIFGEIIRRMPNTKVNIEKDENENIIITCKNSRFEIKGTKGESFPRIPEIKREKSLKVCQAVIKDMISQTIFAVGEDENRPILNGVNIESKNGLLTFVAIDGFRLALRKYIIEDVDADINVVVPGKTLSEIAKILEPTDEDVTIYVAENQIMFDMGNTKVVSRLLEGEYFNYENVIPDEYETKILINRKEFLDSIERASILISSDGTRYPINIALKHDKMIITTNTNIGSAREEIKIEVEGNDIEAKFNPRYFIEALKEIDEENIDVSFNSDVGPCIIKRYGCNT
jgi:DNA polymerase-3 subunit beta